MAVVGINSNVPPIGIGATVTITTPAGGTTGPAPGATPQPTAVAAIAATGPQPLNTNGALGTTVNIVA